MKKNNIHIDNHGKGLLIGLINKALNDDKSLASDKKKKLKEIKKQLQEA